MKKLFCVTALVMLTACTTGNPLNQTRDTFNPSGLLDERDHALSDARCHDSIARSPGFDSPAETDYIALYDACMAKRGWTNHADKPTPAQAPAPQVNE